MKTLLYTCFFVMVCCSTAWSATNDKSAVIKAKKKAIPLEQKVDSLIKKLRKQIKEKKIPGVGIAIVSKQKVLFAGGLGYANVKKKIPVSAKTLYRIGSITKMFVGLGVLKLQEQGKLQLTSKVAELVPEIQINNHCKKTNPIRVEHLLEHTAGFDDMHFNEFYNLKHRADYPLKKMLALNPKSRRTRWCPGTWTSYANPGYGVAGYVIEKVTKQRYESYLKKELFLPLGMNDSIFYKSEDKRGLLAQGYMGKSWKKATYRAIYHRPAGAILSSPRDMARFLQMLIRRGQNSTGKQLFAKASIGRMETPKTSLSVRKGQRQGYGLGNYSEYRYGVRTYGHAGDIDGFHASARYSVDQGLGYVLLFNQSGRSKQQSEVEKLVAKTIFISPKKKTVVASKQELGKQFFGAYYPSHSRNKLLDFLRALSWFRIRKLGKKVVFESFKFYTWKKVSELEQQASGLWMSKGKFEAQFLFVRSKKKKAMLFIGPQAMSKSWSFLPWLYAAGFAFALFSIVLGILFLLIWLPRKIFAKNKPKFTRERILPLIAVGCFAYALSFIKTKNLYLFGEPNFMTISFFAFMLLFAMFATLALLMSLRALFQKRNQVVVRIFNLCVSISVFGLLVFSWPLVGVRLWAGW